MKRIIILVLILSSTLCFGAKKKKWKCPAKWGKVTKAELEMKVYDKDTSANAVVLADVGRVEIVLDTYSGDVGFKYEYHRYIRIKIINKKGYKYANDAINYYESNSSKETIRGFKATTFNLVDGKIVKTKLSKGDKFKEMITDNNYRIKYALPNVKEGSIIEIKYVKKSPFYSSLPVWEFQKEIPIVWSDFQIEIPEEFTYRPVMFGYLGLTHREVKYKTSHSFNSNLTVTRMIMADVEALESESHTTTVKNYISHIRFELKNVSFPGYVYQNFSASWKQIAKDLNDNSYFGKRIEGSSFLKKTVKELTDGLTTEDEKINKIYNHVKTTIKWDYDKSYKAISFKKVIKKGSGDSGDINLLLISMLQKAGINVKPVLLSTRGHGIIRRGFPSENSFNYVVAAIKRGDKYMFLDATLPYNEINILPYNCHNDGKGLLLAGERYRWIDLPLNNFFSTKNYLDIEMKKDGAITGLYQTSENGLSAIKRRNNYMKNNDKEEYIKNIENNITGMSIDSLIFNELNVVNKPLKRNIYFSLEGDQDENNKLIYINPLLFTQIGSNPFKIENRTYPVDFGYKKNTTNIVKFKIPDGYEVEELPEKKVFALPNSAGRYIYNIVNKDGTIFLTTRLSIKKKLFLPNEYPSLRMFYNKVIEKSNQNIILKKIES